MSCQHKQTRRNSDCREILRTVQDLCATLENEENERRELERARQRPACSGHERVKPQPAAPKHEVLQCTPCRYLDNCTPGKQRRNAVPNICTASGEVALNHLYVNRFINPDPRKMPLITYPEYQEQSPRPRTPPKKVDLYKKSSRELLAGYLYERCDCSKRNGLQDNCPRTECLARVDCKSLPEPCCPNTFEARQREARRSKEKGRFGSPRGLYCPKP